MYVIKKTTLRHKLETFDAFKNRVDKCLKFALKNALPNNQNSK